MARCIGCKVTKLPNEFPPEPVTDDCEHPILFCLRCTVRHVADTARCPCTNCPQTVNTDSQRFKFFNALLNEMFKEYSESNVCAADDIQTLKGDALHVTLLTGECISVIYNENEKIVDLKREIEKETKQEPDKQKLLYKGTELKDRVKGKLACLSDYCVAPNSLVNLVIRLMSIPTSFDNVIFDLHWGYPRPVSIFGSFSFSTFKSRDYLDATCFMYEGNKCMYICDFRNRNPIPAIKHSGDVMDDKKKVGHHKIRLSLKKVPPSISHLFFTLSAWNAPRIARYPNPSLKFYSADEPSKDLCKTTFSHAIHSQAVIMCSVTRDDNGVWEIFQSGKCSGGNAKSYKPLKNTIENVILSRQN